MLNRYYYSASIKDFLITDPLSILGELAKHSEFALEDTQRRAWEEQITILVEALQGLNGSLFFEFNIPRMGKRIDVVCIIDSYLFLLEFKVGEKSYPAYAIDQVMDYALDLKNFHETSHNATIIPILVSTDAPNKVIPPLDLKPYHDLIYKPVLANTKSLRSVLLKFLSIKNSFAMEVSTWQSGSYKPTPTIIEAATALYKRHDVEEITRKEANAKNLRRTKHTINEIITTSKNDHKKSICFVTGVPGAGKTLVGLDVATKHIDRRKETYSVFLSGNGPLVAVLVEALAKDRVNHENEKGGSLRIGEARSEVKAFIQNVHHFRDEGLRDTNPPAEHVTLFDEAQRAWNKEKTTDFMKRKKAVQNFNMSEPEFLISCMNRHTDWAVIVCLVGGGQEIHDGEAGIGEWIRSLDRSFSNWEVYISPQLTDSEYNAQTVISETKSLKNIIYKDDLHLSVSMRSFRAEHLSGLMKKILDFEEEGAKSALKKIRNKYPILLTRDVTKAKNWLKQTARGTERYGMVVSSQASRLKPLAVDIRVNIDPIHWFLDDKSDTRSSFYLEDVATEFQVQGLELDWTCVIWDADFRYAKNKWIYKSFQGTKWNNINKEINQQYLLNAYRVLLTRARQGMVIVVPEGDVDDPTRLPEFYDPTYDYLKGIGFEVL